MAKSERRRAQNREHDARRRRQPHRKLYKDPRWIHGREVHLGQHPLCVYCHQSGVVRAATVVNHKIPHRGDVKLFFDPANWESCCAPCHDIIVQRMEVRGYAEHVDADGWPMDPMHPANQHTVPTRAPARGRFVPPGGGKSLEPSVSGPAGNPRTELVSKPAGR